MNNLNDYILAASQWDDNKVINYLNQNDKLAQESGTRLAKVGAIYLQFTGNGLHHALLGPVEQFVPAIDGKVERIVAKLLELKCDVNEQEPNFMNTPLHWLCSTGDDVKTLAKILYDATPQDDDLYTDFNELYTQKMAANQAPRLKIAEMLLKAGAKASLSNALYQLPINLIEDREFKAKMDALFKKYQPNYLEEGDRLVQEMNVKNEMTLLIEENDAEGLRKRCKNPNSKSRGGLPLIIFALVKRRTEAFLALVELKADLSATSPEKMDLFDLVVDKYDDTIFRKLLDLDFDPNRINQPRTITYINYLEQFSKVYWHKLALHGNVDAIETLIAREVNLDMETQIEDYTILDLLKENKLKDHPLLKQIEEIMKNELSNSAFEYELVQMVEKFPFLKETKGVPELVKERYKESPDFEQIAGLYLQLMENYKERSETLKYLFEYLEGVQLLLAGVNDNHRQIIKLLEESMITNEKTCFLI